MKSTCLSSEDTWTHMQTPTYRHIHIHLTKKQKQKNYKKIDRSWQRSIHQKSQNVSQSSSTLRRTAWESLDHYSSVLGRYMSLSTKNVIYHPSQTVEFSISKSPWLLYNETLLSSKKLYRMTYNTHKWGMYLSIQFTKLLTYTLF